MAIQFRISKFDVQAHHAWQYLRATAEVDIRSAHGEALVRPIAPPIPEYVYLGAVLQQELDRKEYELEIEAQMRAAQFPEG